jgi:hypothetical protein
MHQQLWGYKVEEKLYLGVTRTKKVEYRWSKTCHLKHKSSYFSALVDKCSNKMQGIKDFKELKD